MKAVYHSEIIDDRTVHAIDHDNGGFMVSSMAVGVAVRDFLNNATATDMLVLHGHLLYAFKNAFIEEQDDVRENISHWMDAEFGKKA